MEIKSNSITFNFSTKVKCTSQQRFGHRKSTTSRNKLKDTPIKHGYHLEDYDRQCVYEHYYNGEEKPFYVGQGTLQQAFVFNGNRRHESYNNYVKDVNLIKVVIVDIDVTPEQGVQLEKELIAKYRFIYEGGTLVNVVDGGKRGPINIGKDNPLIQMNYSEENGNILIQGKELLIPFSKYIGDNIQEILNSAL